MSTWIKGIGGYLPERVVTSEELEEMAGYKDHGVKLGLCKMLTGCASRHWAAKEELCSDIAARAGEIAMKEAGVNIVGLGYTIYLGSEYEATMMAEAGELIAQAHANGLIVVLWIYPRGKAVTAEKDPDLIAGAAGVALCLGADFVKVNPPKPEDGRTPAEALKVASTAAGRCGLVCAGGSTVDAETFLTQLYDQIHVGGADGNATGRNIHQRSLDEAVRLTKAISAITLADWAVADALAVFAGEKDFTLADI